MTRVLLLLSLAGHYEEKKIADQGTAVKEILRRSRYIKEFISTLTPDIFLKARHPRAEPFRARSIGLWLVGHHPIRSEGDYSPGPGLNATCMLLCPRSTGLAPRLPYGYLLINSLVVRLEVRSGDSVG